MIRHLPALSVGLVLAGLTAACEDRPADRDPAPAPATAAGDETPPTASIIRPSVRAEIEKRAEPAPEPVEARVLFDYGSADLSDAARTRLDEVLATEGLVDSGWTLTLTGRTDSRGGIQANQRMAQERAEAVRDYLVAGGLAIEQITVVAAGEVEPAPDQAGMDASAARRVDVLATPPPPT
ncbi:OmpA family protein [uncultured Brevundimonas sp.]|uniref:OmpA family protein n=1 Tax=uncultured Brevundimonas sp. TaxID=213418 RepID=UPI0030ECF7E2|tara:strand:- start:113894 stop:114436 length:543 start_codon:yes stop_codon:yes gene_type:complete